MRFALGMLSLVFLALAATVHAATVLGINVSRELPYVYLIQAGLVVVAAPYLIADLRGKPDPDPEPEEIAGTVPGHFGGYPQWTWVVGAILVFYALAVSVPWYWSTGGGIPWERDGRYVLEKQYGEVVRVLTKDEYHEQQILFLRSFSSLWLMQYYLVAALMLFRYRAPVVQPAEAPPL